VLAHDTELALLSAAALVNTGHGGERLASVADLDAFLREWGWTGGRRRGAAELDSVRRLRPRLERIWYVDEDAAVEIVNRMLRDADALPQLVKHDGWDYHLHATAANAPLADRMVVEAAMALTDLIRTRQLGRLRVCAADDCRDVLVDLSKNHSRRFCSAQCANRVNVAAFRARHGTANLDDR
jgi:predicted RNA-binding Zn ribbon-like protein